MRRPNECVLCVIAHAARIGERQGAAHSGRPGIAIKHGGKLLTGDIAVGVRSIGHAVFPCPRDALIIPVLPGSGGGVHTGKPRLSVFTVPVEPSAALFSVTELPLGLVVVLEVLPSLAVVVSTLVPSGLVVVSTFPVLPELSRSEDEPPPKLLKPPEENPPPPEEEPPEDWA